MNLNIKLRDPIKEKITDPREFNFALCIYKASGRYYEAQTKKEKKVILSKLGIKNLPSKKFELIDAFLQGIASQARLCVENLNDVADNTFIPCDQCKLEDYCKGFEDY